MSKYIYNNETKELKEIGMPAHTGAQDEYFLDPKYVLLFDTDYIADRNSYIARLEARLREALWAEYYHETPKDEITKEGRERHVDAEMAKLKEGKS